MSPQSISPTTPTTTDVKPIAIVLPQFHPIPENDEWWGKGFTEWRNVVKGRPLFRGHYQPHLPADLGFYDLRLPETRIAQVELAREYGIHGFCYYHYWFGGRRLLERPVDDILSSGQPDFPFMLCWANEHWSRNWDGGFNQVLVEQKYSVEDFIAHAKHLRPYFEDPRYIRVDGKPVFVIYKDALISCLSDGIAAFRDTLGRYGIDVHLCRMERDRGTIADRRVAYSIFDAGIQFQPLSRSFTELRKRITPRRLLRGARRALRKLHLNVGRTDSIYPYADLIDVDLAIDYQEGFPVYPGVSPGFDNSVRRRHIEAIIFDKSSPNEFERWTRGKIQSTQWHLLPERFLFVNAWNEWAEGNHLEPDEKWQSGYLQALTRAVHSRITASPHTSLATDSLARHGRQATAS